VIPWLCSHVSPVATFILVNFLDPVANFILVVTCQTSLCELIVIMLTLNSHHGTSYIDRWVLIQKIRSVITAAGLDREHEDSCDHEYQSREAQSRPKLNPLCVALQLPALSRATILSSRNFMMRENQPTCSIERTGAFLMVYPEVLQIFGVKSHSLNARALANKVRA
jgi:hypothetical protein